MTDSPSITRIGLKYAAFLAAALIVPHIIGHLIDFPRLGGFVDSISFLLFIGANILAIRYFKSQNEEFATFKEAFGIGFIVSVFAGTMLALFKSIMLFIKPIVIDEIIEVVKDQYEAQGLDDEIIESAVEMVKIVMTPGFLFVITVVFTVIASAILSLIMAAIMKNEKF